MQKMIKEEYLKFSIDVYLNSKFLKKDSRRAYDLALKSYFNFIRDNNFDDIIIDEQILKKFYNYLLNIKSDGSPEVKYSEKTCITFLKVVGDYLRFCNILIDYEMPKENYIIKEKDIVPKAVFDKLVSYFLTKDDYKNAFLSLCAYYLGFKSKRIADITFNNFNENKKGFYYSNSLVEGLNEYKIYMPIQARDVFKKIEKENENIYIFTVKHGGVLRKYSTHYTTSIIKKALDELDLYSYTPNNFRHTAVYNFIRENPNISLDEIKLRFEWSDVNIYYRMYEDLIKEDKEK